MSSVTSSTVRETLAAYLAGRAKAERVVAEVAREYFGEGGRGKREGLKPIVEVIERAHPGIVELVASAQQPGYDVRLAQRPFPSKFEDALRTAVSGVLQGVPATTSTPASGR